MKPQLSLVGSFALAVCLAVGSSGSVAQEARNAAGDALLPEYMNPMAHFSNCSVLTSNPIFQVINPVTQANLLTAWQNEASDAARLHGFTIDNGTPFHASLNALKARANGLFGAHRMFNSKSNDFFWTINPLEMAIATLKYGYKDQGINFYVSATPSSCTKPVYRFLLGNKHRFAFSQEERNTLTAEGWTYEGIVFYGGAVADTSSSMPVGDLDGWRQIFTEDFTKQAPLGKFTSVYGDRWLAYPYPWRDTSKNGTYNPEKVLSVSNGVLDWHLHTENGEHNVGAVMPLLPTSSEGSQTYGKYTFRFRAEPIPGYKLVILLWPESDIEAEGEIDFPEVGELSTGKDGEMYAFWHYQGEQDSLRTGMYAADNQWHIASIEWRPDSIAYYLDGRLVGTHNADEYGIPSTPFYLVFQMETNTEPTNPPLDSVEGHIQLDWVSIYEPK